LAQVAAGLAAAINGNTAAGYKAKTTGNSVLVLDPGASTVFGATLKIGAGAAAPVGRETPQILVTAQTAGDAFYAEFALGVTLSTIAAELASRIDAALYDVTVRGRVLTISNANATQTRDLVARMQVGPASAGSAVVTPQMLFTSANWNVPQTATVMAIDDQ